MPQTKKLLLTSTGFSNKEITNVFLKKFNKEPSQSRVLMVTGAKTEEENQYIEESKKELNDLGFNHILIYNLTQPVSLDQIKDIDLIYVCGGNTFYYLKKIRETGLDKILIKLVNQGIMYIGVSSGSIIAGPSIEIASWGKDGDTNDLNLKDLTGFNLTHMSIFPHFEEDKHRLEVEEFKKKVDYPIIELTDNQAVFIEGEGYKVIGE